MKILSTAVAVTVSMALFSCNEKKESTTTKEETPVTVVAQQAASEGTAVAVNTESVPENIRTSFNTKYPKASRVEWMSYKPVESDDLVMDDQYYYVRYNNDGADYISWYNNRGDWVKTSTKVKGHADLPDAVNKTINAQYPGYTIVEIDKENDKDRDMYEIELKKGDAKAKLKILPNGDIFKRK